MHTNAYQYVFAAGLPLTLLGSLQTALLHISLIGGRFVAGNRLIRNRKKEVRKGGKGREEGR